MKFLSLHTVAFARRFEMAFDTGWSLFKIFLCEEPPFRPRWRISTLAESRHVTAPWASDLSPVKGSLCDAGARPTSASDFLAGNRYLRDLMAVLAEHPLERLLLAVRQLVMGMNFKGRPAGLAGSTFNPKVVEDYALTDTWDGCPVKGVDLCGHRCAESGNLR